MADAQHNPTDGERFEEFVGLVSSLEKEIARIRAAECERLGVRGGDLMCLYCLGQAQGGMTAAELSRRAGVTRAAVSRSLAQLEQSGLVAVASAPGDARLYRAPVSLTSAGRKTMAEVDEAVSRVMARVDSALDDDQRTRLYASLASVLDCLRAIGR